MSKRVLLLLLLVAAPFGAACDGQQPETWRAETADPELAAMVAELLPRVEALSGLEARDSIRFERRTREALREYVTAQLAAELPEPELRAIERVYGLLGLLPDTLDLRRLLLDLYTEQVLGYYDPESDRLYMVEGVTADALRPVLAHEMVHALQDQHANLDSLVSRERGNDRQIAAQAAIEGHATLTMFRLMLEERLGRSLPLEQLPDLAAQLGAGAAAQNEQFPVFRAAPAIIRETLLYPYTDGAGFVQALWRRYPGAAPLDSLLPQSTEQVSHPAEAFFDARDAPADLSLALDTAGADGWSIAYTNTLGQLELSIFLREQLGPDAAAAALGWEGDRYALLERADGAHALVLWSVWEDEAAARRFAAAARRALESAGRAADLETTAVQGRPAVRLRIAGPGAAAPASLPPLTVTWPEHAPS